jgi:hypothetical protein
MLYTLQGFRLFFARHPTPTTEDMTTTAIQLYASSVIPNVITEPRFATVRIKKGTNQIMDGRIYKTEEQMNRYRSSRPKNAVCIKINRRLNHGLVECEMI